MYAKVASHALGLGNAGSVIAHRVWESCHPPHLLEVLDDKSYAGGTQPPSTKDQAPHERLNECKAELEALLAMEELKSLARRYSWSAPSPLAPDAPLQQINGGDKMLSDAQLLLFFGEACC